GATIYYLSDRDGSQNILRREVTDPVNASGKPLTHFKDGRVAWPTISRDGKTIVFERDFAIWKVDTQTGSAQQVPIKLRGATAGTAVEHQNFGGGLTEMSLSRDG